MKLIKLAAISAVILSVLVTAISFLFPSTVIVSRALEVNCTPDKIAFYTSDLKNWNTWMSDWKQHEVRLQNDTAFIGMQMIHLESKTDSSVNYTWVATGQAPYNVKIEWFPLDKGNYVIHWTFEQHVRWYPWEKFQTLLNEKLLGSKMEQELQNLQTTIYQAQ
ncbi:MAG: SRPBCC family protein [Sediminibacterium sp.]|jgi:hypothetical protein